MTNAIDRKKQRATPASIPAEATADPVGQHTEWHPINSGHSGLRTYVLHFPSTQRAMFRPTRLAICAYFLVLFVGIGSLAKLAFDHWSPDHELQGPIWLPVLIGSVFAVAGVLMLVFQTRPVIFDKTAGWYWEGRRKPTEVFGLEATECAARLTNIHAIQLLEDGMKHFLVSC